MRALASPASLKGVLSATEAAAALAAGMRRVEGLKAVELPVADGGEGTVDVLHRALGGELRTAVVANAVGRPVPARYLVLPPATVVVEAAEAIGLARLEPEELDPIAASSRGLGELLLATLALRPDEIVVAIGGVATVDGGRGMLDVAGPWLRGRRLRVACDVGNPLLGPRGAARVYGPQKGATPDAVDELERRLAARRDLEPYRELPGAGAAGGLGAAFASLGAELVPGAELVLDAIGFRGHARNAALVVTGEGTVDRTTEEGKAPGAVARACVSLGVRCAVFAGRVEWPLDGVELLALSGDPAYAAEDLVALGEELALSLGRAP